MRFFKYRNGAAVLVVLASLTFLLKGEGAPTGGVFSEQPSIIISTESNAAIKPQRESALSDRCDLKVPEGNLYTTEGLPQDGAFNKTTATAAVTPENPVTKECLKGGIRVEVSSPRAFGIHIGEVISVSIRIVADARIKFDFSSLQNGVLGFSGNDFELAAPGESVVVESSIEELTRVYEVWLLVRTFVPSEPGVPFVIHLRYATPEDELPGGQPNWHILETPPLIVTRSATVDNGRELKEGDMLPSPERRPALGLVFFLCGIALIISWPSKLVYTWLNRTVPGRIVPANELAWREFDKVFARMRVNGYLSQADAAGIASALRSYLGISSLTILEAKDRLKEHSQVLAVDTVLVTLESVLYQARTLNEEQCVQLRAQLHVIVPEPDEAYRQKVAS